METKDTMEKLENLYKEAEQRVTLIAGMINATRKTLYWKTSIISAYIGDYAIVENNGGYDLIKIVGIVETTKENAIRISNTAYEDMKNVKMIISKENLNK